MTDTKKKYKWAEKNLRIHLLGAPRFRIVTAHKSLLPMFNKATAKMPQGV